MKQPGWDTIPNSLHMMMSWNQHTMVYIIYILFTNDTYIQTMSIINQHQHCADVYLSELRDM